MPDTPRIRLRQRMKTLPILPTILTSGNLACGVTSILCATHGPIQSSPPQPDSPITYLGWASIFIFLAMICDLFDGKVARMTRTDGPFGKELDSLADIVSFGVAPAILFHVAILGPGSQIISSNFERFIVAISILYAVFAAIRLARYNVEHSDPPAADKVKDQTFTGLPSPGAAAVVATLVGYKVYLSKGTNFADDPIHYVLTQTQFDDLFKVILPAATLVAAFLMVSTIRFPHAGVLLSKRMPVRSFILALLIISLLTFLHMSAIVLLMLLYVFGSFTVGIIKSLRNHGISGKDILEEDDEEDEKGEDSESGKV